MSEWKTLAECLVQVGGRFPLKVYWRGNPSYGYFKEPRKIVFTRALPPSLGAGSLQWYVHDDSLEEARGHEYFVESAMKNDFQLIRETQYCQCDYRNTILVTGCRCGRKRLGGD